MVFPGFYELGAKPWLRDGWGEGGLGEPHPRLRDGRREGEPQNQENQEKHNKFKQKPGKITQGTRKSQEKLEGLRSHTPG